MKLSNKLYDRLKYIALIALPAIQVFWLTIAKIWSLNYGMEIGATIGACALLLGTLLGVSSEQYKQDGQTKMFNEDMLKDMVHYDEAVEEIEESEESEV